MMKYGKSTFMFLGNIAIQLMILSTGGLYSPFLIFFHFSLLATSFIFSFPAALLFFMFSLSNIITQIFLSKELMSYVHADPVTIMVYGASFVPILFLTYYLSRMYHLKDILFDALSKQLKVNDSIVQGINELVFITDTEFKILSANEAVEKIFHKSRTELLQHLIFEILYLRGKDGGFINKDSSELKDVISSKKEKILSNLLLITTDLPRKPVSLLVKPNTDFNDEMMRLTFIINMSSPSYTSQESPHQDLEEAKIRHDALVEDLKQRLKANNTDLANRFLLITSAEQDIATLNNIQDHGIKVKKEPVDVAQLSKQTLANEQEFARALHVPLEFTLPDFDQNKTAQAVAEKFHISADQITGPFYSAQCDAVQTGLLIQKLLQVSILLTSNFQQSKVILSIEQKSSSILIVRVRAFCAHLSTSEEESLLQLYYGGLKSKKNFSLGSGLEGYLAKTIAEYTSIPLHIQNYKESNKCEFILEIDRQVTSLPIQPPKPNAA